MQGTRYLAASLLLLLLATGLDAQSSNCWTWYQGTLIYGGTLISNITNVAACQAFCTLSPGCVSIDWAYSNAQGSQCFLLMTQNGKVSNVNGVDHYDYTCQGGGSGCQFNPFFNTNIYGGTLMNNYNTLATCQAACIAQQSTCQSIDWVPATLQCFFLGTQNGKNPNIQGVNHYDLVCSSTTQLPGASTTTLPGTGGSGGCSFSQPFQNTNIYGGAVNPATTLSGCQNACIMNTSCQGIDWAPGNANGQQCFLLSTQNGKNSNVNGVTHYDYTCGGACVFSQPYYNTNIYGGAANPATTLSGCQNACTMNTSCQGIDWAPGNANGQQCFLLSTQNGKNSNVNGVTHYDYTCNGTGNSTQPSLASTLTTLPGSGACSFSLPFYNTNIYGGSANPATTLTGCQNACTMNTSCQGIDWAPDNANGQQCFLLSTQNGKNPNINGVTHYDYTCNGTGSSTQSSLASTLTTLPGSGGACSFSQPYPNTNIYGGAVNPATTLSGCQSACTMNTSCQGIDWAPDNPSGQQCFLLSTTNGKNPNINGVTHYDYLCIGACSFSLPFQNTNIYGGAANPATTLSGCQNACRMNASCQGIDWAPGNANGQQCFLLSTQNGKNSNINGVTHYDYTCNGTGGSTTVPGGILGSSTTIASQNCWQAFLYTNIYGGTVNPAPSLNACYSACIAVGKSACMSIDWAFTNPAGSQCFLLNTQTGKNPGTAGVHHYDYIC